MRPIGEINSNLINVALILGRQRKLLPTRSSVHDFDSPLYTLEREFTPKVGKSFDVRINSSAKLREYVVEE